MVFLKKVKATHLNIIFIIFIFCMLMSSIVYAGGFPIHVKINQFEYLGNDEFKIIFSHIDGRLPQGIVKDKPIIFYLSKSTNQYEKCINILLNHYKNDEVFYFSTGINENIPGKVNEFQSNWLFLGKGIDRSKMDTVTAAYIDEELIRHLSDEP